MLKKLVASSAVAALTLAASTMAAPVKAATISANGAGFTIPDNNPTGVTSNIVISDDLNITDLTVTLNNLTHTFIGDLITTITHIDTGTTVSLFNRVGGFTPASFGYGSNLGGNYSFNNAFAGNLWTTAQSLGTNQTIPNGNYFPTGAGSAALSSPSLAAFNGESTLGTWRLLISDNASSDTGSLGSWTLTATATPVPEPATSAMFAVAAAGGFLFKKKLMKKKVKA